MTEDCNQDGCGNGGLRTLTLSGSSVTASVTFRVCGSDTAETICLYLLQKLYYTKLCITIMGSSGLVEVHSRARPCYQRFVTSESHNPEQL